MTSPASPARRSLGVLWAPAPAPALALALLTACTARPAPTPTGTGTGTGPIRVDDSLRLVDVKRQAAEGDVYAQRMLAQSYRYGTGVPKDAQLALQWDLKAAEAGRVDSQYDVGMHYRLGLGVEANYPTAFTWLKKAADKKHPAALMELGQMTIAGEATFPDDVLGLRMIRESALLGHAPARQFLEERHGIRLD